VLRGTSRSRSSVTHLGVGVAHFGILITLGVVLLVGLTAGLSLEILRFSALVDLLSGNSGSTTHIHIHLDDIGDLDLVGLLGGFFVRGLIGSVLLGIVGSLIGLWLLRREFGGSRILGIPTSPLLIPCANNWQPSGNIPFDGEPRDSGLLGQHVAHNPLEDRLVGRLVLKLGGVVFVADIVANTDELTTIVGTGEEDDGDSQNLGGGKLGDVRRLGLEDELVNPNRDGADKQFSQFLVVVGAVCLLRVSSNSTTRYHHRI